MHVFWDKTSYNHSICNTTNILTTNNETAAPFSNLPTISSDQCYLTSTEKKHINPGQYVTIKCVLSNQQLFSAFLPASYLFLLIGKLPKGTLFSILPTAITPQSIGPNQYLNVVIFYHSNSTINFSKHKNVANCSLHYNTRPRKSLFFS